MHVAIVGAGSLGAVFGVRLACGPDAVRVSFVTRSVAAERPITIEQVDATSVLTLERPTRVTSIPDDADVILICVRFEQIDSSLARLLEPSRAPVVTMTPLFPDLHAFLERAVGPDRLFPGMPGVVAYRSGTEETYRYWLPRVATTLIERPAETDVPAIDALSKALEAAGIASRVQPGVHATNMATTFTFVPVMMGIDVAGSIDALLADDATLDLVLRAADESRSLAHEYGRPALWAEWFVRFTSPSLLGSWTPKSMITRGIKLGISFARRRSKEGVHYVEEHFGRKLRAQNLLMAEKMVGLFRQHGRPHEAMTELRDRLRAVA